MKREIPAEVIENLRQQLFESAKEKDEERQYKDTLYGEYELDSGETLVVDAEVAYWPRFEHCVCSTDRGDDEWNELASLETELLNITAAVYDSDNELIEDIQITDTNRLMTLLQV